MKNQQIILMIVSGLVLSSCRGYEPQGNDSGMGNDLGFVCNSQGIEKNDVQFAYEQARSSMLSEKQVQIDVLWVLRQFAAEDVELRLFIEEMKKGVATPHYVPLVFPDLPRIQLPASPDVGIKRFITYLQAAFGSPEDQAMLYIRDFIAMEESGYILTHQFLCLVWAEQAELPLTNDMLTRKQELWNAVYKEQCSANALDSLDLYMERFAIVLAYGHTQNIDQSLVGVWMKTILNLQLEDGSWPLSKTRISYDGATTLLSSPRSHTTVLAMMALNAYLQK